MKTILRNLASGLYFQGGASWTENADDAFHYHNLEDALEAVHSSSMAGLELNALLFDDPRYTLRVPLDDFFPKAGNLNVN